MKRLILIASLILVSSSRAPADEMELTLRRCLELALRSSLEIKEGSYLPAIATTLVDEAESEFDHLFTFDTSGGREERPTGSDLAGAAILEEDRWKVGAALEQKVRTGGIYSFGLDTDSLYSNSAFMTLRPAWANAFSFRFSQPVLRRAGVEYNEAGIRIAETRVSGAEQDYRAVLNRTLASVERAYWELVFAREDLRVKQTSLGLSKELLRISVRRLEAGAGTKVEKVQAEAGVAQRETEVILAEARVRRAEDSLRAFIFPFTEDPESEIWVVPTDPVDLGGEPPRQDLALRIRLAFGYRPDVLAAEATLKQAGIEVVQRENELLPRLDFFGNLAFVGLTDSWTDSAQDVLSAEYPAWELGLSFEVPIGNRAARARHRRAVLERSRLVAGFESLKNQVVLQVRDALRVAETARLALASTRRSTIAAEAQFEAEKDRVRAEKSTNWQLLQVEQELADARSAELRAKVTYRAALASLEEISGTYLMSRQLEAPEPRDLGAGGTEQP
jgi:outer membrane protein TolC